VIIRPAGSGNGRRMGTPASPNRPAMSVLVSHDLSEKMAPVWISAMRVMNPSQQLGPHPGHPTSGFSRCGLRGRRRAAPGLITSLRDHSHYPAAVVQDGMVSAG